MKDNKGSTLVHSGNTVTLIIIECISDYIFRLSYFLIESFKRASRCETIFFSGIVYFSSELQAKNKRKTAQCHQRRKGKEKQFLKMNGASLRPSFKQQATVSWSVEGRTKRKGICTNMESN